MRIVIAALATLGLLGTWAATAQARSCPGTITAPKSGLAIIKVKATGTSCKTAKHVAVAFDKALMGTAHAEHRDSATVSDQQGHPWRCRITERATGTDPGSIPYTSVACKRDAARIRFKFAS